VPRRALTCMCSCPTWTPRRHHRKRHRRRESAPLIRSPCDLRTTQGPHFTSPRHLRTDDTEALNRRAAKKAATRKRRWPGLPCPPLHLHSRLSPCSAPRARREDSLPVQHVASARARRIRAMRVEPPTLAKASVTHGPRRARGTPLIARGPPRAINEARSPHAAREENLRGSHEGWNARGGGGKDGRMEARRSSTSLDGRH
jgi:hypothetical protein